jgi:uncharacterized protein YggT (Ycf19 family)
MSSSYFTNPLEFLINTLFGLFILALMLRFLLAWVRADFYNPVSQFLVKITNPVLVPLRRIVPSLGGIDIAAILLMLLFQMISLTIILVLRGAGITPGNLVAAFPQRTHPAASTTHAATHLGDRSFPLAGITWPAGTQDVDYPALYAPRVWHLTPAPIHESSTRSGL